MGYSGVPNLAKKKVKALLLKVSKYVKKSIRKTFVLWNKLFVNKVMKILRPL